MNRPRACMDCGRPIAACMGAVIPRDVVAHLDGQLAGEHVRELCWACLETRSDRRDYEYGDNPHLLAASP